MNEPIIEINNISKKYRIGEVGTGTISHDLNRWWHKIRGKEDPYSIIGEKNDRTIESQTGYTWALNDINLNINRGEIVGLIGRNGAGKSTLLKVLSRITSPTKGKITINGRVGSLLEVGTGMHEELTGRENIFLNGAILGMTKTEISENLDEIIEFAGIRKYVDTPFKRYSSGMRVRLGFAVAAFLEPEILLVDEVLAVGDAEFQSKAIGKMQEISKGQGRTVIFVSHNMGSIKSLCNRSILMDNGMISFDGDTDECIAKYLNVNSNVDSTNLLTLKNRTGNRKLLFSNIDFTDKENNSITEVFSGNLLKVRVGFKIQEKIAFDKLIFVLNIKNSYGVSIMSFTSDEMGLKTESKVEKNTITLVIPKLMLRGGHYTIRLLAMEGDTNKENFLDEIETAAKLTVLSSDYWNTGKVLRSDLSAFSDGELYIE